MSDVPFYRTQMGHRFYEHTVPELVRQIGRVADLLEQLTAAAAKERLDRQSRTDALDGEAAGSR
jgi:hypothetical protein